MTQLLFSTYNVATNGNLASTWQLGGSSVNVIEIHQITMKLTTASTLTNSLTITRNPAAPNQPTEDILIQDMTTVKSLNYRPTDGPKLITGKDSISMSWTADKAWGIEIFGKA